VGDLGSLRIQVRAEQPALRQAGIPARLRSLFSVGGWSGRKPEPRVRYGQRFLPGLATLGRQHMLEARPLLERAEAVRGRRFTHLGTTVGFPGRIEWEPAGLSEAWRIAMNGLDDLTALGVAAALAPTSDARRVWYELAAGLVREWIASATPGRGVAWELAALARRIPNLVYAYAFFAAELRADPRQRGVLLESLYVQASALAAALPGQPADHRLIDAGRALFVAGRFFDGMEARGWLESGAGILWGQLREQVHEDGGHRGRNPVEHALVLASYLEVLGILHASNDDVPIWARKRLKGMADFLARILHPDGEIPLFHGSALGVARPARELLAVAAVVLHEPGLAPPGELTGIWPLLVIGEAGRRTHASLPRRPAGAEPRALRRTGFYVMPGEPGDVMLLDGDSPPPGGDAAAFGYELSLGGERLIVGSGTASEDNGEWGEYFRSTRAHNVVSVSDGEQVAAGRLPVVSEAQWAVRDGLLYFSGVHDGFARLSLDLRLRHRRRVFCMPGRFWIVCEEILGSGTGEAESYVHFHPATTFTATCRERPGFTVVRSSGARLQLVPAGAREVRVVHGVESPRVQGWYAPRHGERHAAPVLSLIARGRLPLAFGYVLVPRSDEAVDLAFEHDAFHLRATLRLGGLEYLLSVAQGEVEMVTRPA
jgi:hypothetical protein